MFEAVPVELVKANPATKHDAMISVKVHKRSKPPGIADFL